MTAPEMNGHANGASASSETYPLPTNARLGQDLPLDVDASKAAEEWLEQFAHAANQAAAGNGSGVARAFLADGWWRDKAALTWDYRTLHGEEKIKKCAEATFKSGVPSHFKLAIAPLPERQQPYPDLAYIQAHFTFTTKVAVCSAVVNIVLTSSGYRAWTLSTILEGLRDFPEVGRPDGHISDTTTWKATREAKAAFVDEDPEVIITGAGHNGLVLAARLQALGVKVLIVEANERVGDNWRKRYESLSLHFPVWQDHLPYIPFPKQWPVYTPSGKVGNWLESYADSLDLNVWTSSKVSSSVYNESKRVWEVMIERAGKEPRKLSTPHFVVATGLAGTPNIPKIPGAESFTGTIRHSSTHDSAKHWKGKKVLVVGTSSSGFDAALDCARNDVEVTMLQRSATYVMSLTHGAPAVLGSLYSENGPPIEIADRIAWSMPTNAGEELAKRMTGGITEKDHDMIVGLKKAGFNWWSGIKGTGTVTLGWERAGGFYYDAGCTAAVIDGRVKIQQGQIASFNGDKVAFVDGKEEHYDLVILATGYAAVKESLTSILGEDVGSRLKRVWGLDPEGELNGVWKDMGMDGLWVMVGTFGWARFHSKIVAAQIKAMLEGINGKRYSA